MYLYQENKLLSNAVLLKEIHFKTNTKGDQKCKVFVIEPYPMKRNCERINHAFVFGIVIGYGRERKVEMGYTKLSNIKQFAFKQ